jgi:NAD+-dependent protein deacetylase sirtuin 5
MLAPNSTFTLITQNVDGLSSRALEQVLSSKTAEGSVPESDADQAKIIEMHGRLFDVNCTSCGHTEFNMDSPICEALAGTEDSVEEGAMDPNIPVSALPRCSKCKNLGRPGVVWFGEAIQHEQLIDKLVDEADLCLVVGTSSTVSQISC